MIRKLFGAFALLALLVGAAPPRAGYAESQVWEYKTRSGDDGSLIKIQKIEPYPTPQSTGKVYHISVIGLHIKSQPLASEVQHLPVSKATLDVSLTKLSDSTAIFPNASEGRAMWREANGGIFTIPLSDVMDVVEKAYDQAPPK